MAYIRRHQIYLQQWEREIPVLWEAYKMKHNKESNQLQKGVYLTRAGCFRLYEPRGLLLFSLWAYSGLVLDNLSFVKCFLGSRLNTSRWETSVCEPAGNPHSIFSTKSKANKQEYKLNSWLPIHEWQGALVKSEKKKKLSSDMTCNKCS